MSLANDRTMVNIGRLGAAVGLKGEVRVLLYADDSENLYEGAVLLIDADRFSAGVDDNSVYGVRHSAEIRSEEHTSELQSRINLVCRLLLEKKK